VTAPRVVVIGVGSEYRRDDGVGPAVIAALRSVGVPDGVELTVSDGEPTRLLEAWTGAELVVIVDAVRGASPTPGRLHRTELGAPATEPGTAGRTVASSHGLGVLDAVALARALGRAPSRVVVHTVEAGDLGFGPGLSPAVENAVPVVLRAVLADVAGATANGRKGPVGSGLRSL
jgi:hydrogenase maturation protease